MAFLTTITWLLMLNTFPVLAQESQTSPNTRTGDQPRIPVRAASVVLTQEYGYYLVAPGRPAFRMCRVSAGFFDSEGAAGFWCEITSVPPKAPLQGKISLNREEIDTFGRLFIAAKLFDERHVGCPGEIDGTFETLQATADRATAVLVLGCNPSFETDPARRDLLAFVRGLLVPFRDSAKAR
jgi:hypothetical protein